MGCSYNKDVLNNLEASKILNDLAIRSQAKAIYSNENIGHFGLGSKCYSHFTSPIRRYPDLILHQTAEDVNKKVFTPQADGQGRLPQPLQG